MHENGATPIPQYPGGRCKSEIMLKDVIDVIPKSTQVLPLI